MQDELDRKEEQVLRSKAKVSRALPPWGHGKLGSVVSLMGTQARSTLIKQDFLQVRAKFSLLFSAELGNILSKN